MTSLLVKELAAFAVRYDEMLERERAGLGIASWRHVRDDWWLGFDFFLNRAFYQGRSDQLSARFRLATDKALVSLLGDDDLPAREHSLLELARAGWLARERWRDPTNPAWAALSRSYTVSVDGREQQSSAGKLRDREMVLDTMRFVAEHGPAPGKLLNLAEYYALALENSTVAEAHRELQSIRQVGPKIASFFLRDLVAVLGLQPRLDEADFAYLQPVDTWIRQIADAAGIDAGSEGLAMALTRACQQAGVDPIRFNQGAWYLGAHAFEVLLANLARIAP